MLDKYKITIDDIVNKSKIKTGIDKIAYTNDPAILVKGFGFNNQKQLMFKTDEVKMRIAAPLIIPMDIYRMDDDGYEYDVTFEPEVIEEIHKQFMSSLNNTDKNYNLEHDANQIIEENKSYVLEIWIVENPELDKSFTTYGIKVPKGTLFLVSQLTDKVLFNELVNEGKTGYSIEGILGLKLNKNKNKNKNTMKNKLELFTVDGKFFAYVNGEFIEQKVTKLSEVTEEVKEEIKLETDVKVEEETKLEDVKVEDEEVKMEDIKVEEETKLEDAKVEEEVKMEVKTEKAELVTEEEVLTFVQPKLDEIYTKIAELFEALDSKMDKPEEATSEQVTQFNIHQRFNSIMKQVNSL